MRAVDCGFQSRKKSMGGLSTNPERILNGISEVQVCWSVDQYLVTFPVG